MNEKHTPGPWRIEYEPYCHVRSDAGCVLASDYTTEANARLIAAAPDLLAALQAALAESDRAKRDFTAMGHDWAKAARSAIAKAAGQQ